MSLDRPLPAAALQLVPPSLLPDTGDGPLSVHLARLAGIAVSCGRLVLPEGGCP